MMYDPIDEVYSDYDFFRYYERRELEYEKWLIEQEEEERGDI